MRRHGCAAPLPFETTWDYVLGELAEAELESIEDRLFACDACAEAVLRCEDLARSLAAFVPPALSRPRLARLEREGARLLVTPIAPGATVTIPFPREVDYLIHHLELAARPTPDEHVSLVVESEAGQLINAIDHVPVDREVGRVTIACQRHYVELWSPDVRLRLSAEAGGGSRPLGEYVVRHVLPR